VLGKKTFDWSGILQYYLPIARFACVKCECSFSLEFDSAETASKVLDSVKLDNGEWIAARLDDKRIVCEASSDTIGGLLHTAEDFLACIALAEKMMRKK